MIKVLGHKLKVAPNRTDYKMLNENNLKHFKKFNQTAREKEAHIKHCRWLVRAVGRRPPTQISPHGSLQETTSCHTCTCLCVCVTPCIPAPLHSMLTFFPGSNTCSISFFFFSSSSSVWSGNTLHSIADIRKSSCSTTSTTLGLICTC